MSDVRDGSIDHRTMTAVYARYGVRHAASVDKADRASGLSAWTAGVNVGNIEPAIAPPAIDWAYFDCNWPSITVAVLL